MLTTRRPIVFLALLTFASSVTFVAEANAETIIKFDLVGSLPGPDMGFESGTLGLIPELNSGTGDQSTNLEFLGFLNMPQMLGASMSISGVTADGMAMVAGQSVTQATTGGTFSIWDNSSPDDVLLLAGNIDGGTIIGSDTGTAGSFLTTSPIMFTGGTLFPELDATSGALSVALLEIRTTSDNSSGLSVSAGVLQDFTATANGQLGAAAVPEPSVLGMAAIGALVVFRQHRRRKAKTA